MGPQSKQLSTHAYGTGKSMLMSSTIKRAPQALVRLFCLCWLGRDNKVSRQTLELAKRAGTV